MELNLNTLTKQERKLLIEKIAEWIMVGGDLIQIIIGNQRRREVVEQTTKVRSERDILTYVLLVLLLISSLLVGYYFCRIYYVQAHKSYLDLWRLLWLAPFASLGLGVRSFLLRKHQDPPYKAYTMYGFGLGAMGVIMFSVFHNLLPFSDWQYYPLSAALIFLIGLDPWSSGKKLINLLSSTRS